MVLLSDEFEKLNIFLSRGCFCGRLEFKTKYNAAGEISNKSSGRDVLVYWAVIIIRLSWFNPQPTRALAAFKNFYKTKPNLSFTMRVYRPFLTTFLPCQPKLSFE